MLETKIIVGQVFLSNIRAQPPAKRWNVRAHMLSGRVKVGRRPRYAFIPQTDLICETGSECAIKIMVVLVHEGL